jgi:sarcosine oxidase, subunit gamma
MASAAATRLPPLAGLAFINRPEQVEIADAGSCARFLYRGAPEALGSAFRVALPVRPCCGAVQDDYAALWLGPDEWLLIAPAETQASLLMAAMRSGLSGKPASLVNISHRNFALIVSGSRSAELLATGCPLDLDLSAFPVSMCARTLFGKSEIVLWRTAEQMFRLEAWRSFAPYVVNVLNEAAVRLPLLDRAQ